MNVNVETILLFACVSAAGIFLQNLFYVCRNPGMVRKLLVMPELLRKELIEMAVNWCYIILH